jgi:hypothetical protein
MASHPGVFLSGASKMSENHDIEKAVEFLARDNFEMESVG